MTALTVLLAFLTLLSSGIAIFALYRVGLKQQGERLREVVAHQATLLQSVATFDSKHSQAEHPDGWFGATLDRMREAHDEFEGLGQSGELTLSETRGGEAVLLLSHAHRERGPSGPPRLQGGIAEAQRRALGGESGILRGRDSRGEEILAAFQSVLIPEHRLAIVAAIDMAEIRAPYLQAGLAVAGLTATLLLLGLGVFRSVGGTLVSELEESENLYRSLFENALVGMALHEIITDDMDRPVDYRFLAVNEGFERLTGLGRDAVEGKTFLEIFPENADDPFIETYGRVALTEEPTTFEEFSTGLDRYYSIFASSPRPRFFAVLFVDITDRVQQARELQDLNQSLEARVAARTSELGAAVEEMEVFASSISHDLRVPLRAVDGYAYHLLKRYGERLDRGGRRLLEGIVENAGRMGDFIEELLELSRVGGQELALEPIVMDRLVDDVLQDLRGPGEDEALAIDVGVLPEARGDRVLLRLVWQNLLGNAIKFTSRQTAGRVVVKGWEEGESVVFSVEDNGVGFDASRAHKLFKPFQRLHGVTEFEGSGVGLSIVDRIVRRHGGEVGGESGPDGGARFWFSLPNLGVPDSGVVSDYSRGKGAFGTPGSPYGGIAARSDDHQVVQDA